MFFFPVPINLHVQSLNCRELAEIIGSEVEILVLQKQEDRPRTNRDK
jgi:hypothetical protein